VRRGVALRGVEEAGEEVVEERADAHYARADYGGVGFDFRPDYYVDIVPLGGVS